MTSISQSIRDAALRGRLGFTRLGPVESHILNIAFSNPSDPWYPEQPNFQWRTYMLLVAEALSPEIPREDLLRAANYIEGKTDRLAYLSATDWPRLVASLRSLAGVHHAD